ncbi:methylated-DNA--[protein]-cysteine S-methyltransferase [Neptunicella sp. SCSIO 80796]|uniref:methylated-DNA--[protein]-cysteine S-methyltransferase n=1 Tax=Neptunicella plasticusilytica TaxID=3117012 RepID=UPI003A4D7F27
MNIGYLNTDIGWLEIAASDEGIQRIKFVEQCQFPEQHNAHVEQAIAQLDEYFNHQRREFDLTLAAAGTLFQQQVWKTLTSVPHGKTCSYADIADSIGNPKAVRAVGSANGKNPIAIVVPCHRIIGSNGKLTGYAGGLFRKEYLLKLEQL